LADLLPFQDLYDEFESAVTSDAATDLSDFSPGSRLDAYAGVAATAAQTVMRWISRQVRRVFISTSSGADLEVAVADRYGDAEFLQRRAGEDDEAYRARVLEYAQNLGRGTVSALEYYLRSVRTDLEPDTVSVSEDFETGILTLQATALAGEDIDVVTSSIVADLPDWRPAAHGWNVIIDEAG
jgi:hypothetical protein